MDSHKVNENILFETVDECLDRCIDVQHILIKKNDSGKINTLVSLSRDCADLCPLLMAFIIRKSVLTVEVGQTLRQACLLLIEKLKELDNTSPEIKSCIKTSQKCADMVESYFNRIKINPEIKQYKAA